MSELKPCPFCSSDRVVQRVGTERERFVDCEDCGAKGPVYATDDACVVGWNEVVRGDSAPAGQGEGLSELLDDLIHAVRKDAVYSDRYTVREIEDAHVAINLHVDRLVAGLREDLKSEQLYKQRCNERIWDLEAQLNAYPADWRKDSSLETWFPITAMILADRDKEIAQLREQLNAALESAVASTKCMNDALEAKDKIRDERNQLRERLGRVTWNRILGEITGNDALEVLVYSESSTVTAVEQLRTVNKLVRDAALDGEPCFYSHYTMIPEREPEALREVTPQPCGCKFIATLKTGEHAPSCVNAREVFVASAPFGARIANEEQP